MALNNQPSTITSITSIILSPPSSLEAPVTRLKAKLSL
jgi:hypothetical protein